MKKIIVLFLAIIIVVNSFAITAVVASDIKTSKLNDSVSWELSNGKLTVYGVGKVEIPQGSYFMPWRKYADEITQVEIKDGITEIGNAAFAHLGNVYDIPIPNSVISIGEHAFTNCTNLFSVKLPNNLKSVGKNAFYGCSNLKSVTITKSITYMGEGVFADCISLIDVNIEDGLKVISPYTFSGCSSLTNINIPSSVLSIEEYAFYSCYSLQNVMFEGHTQIANNAFERCTSLKSNKPSSESFNTTANDRITVTLNNELIYFDVQPIEIEGRVLVPVRAIFEALGATVNWDGEKNEVKSTKGDITIILYKDGKTMYKNGTPIVLDVPAKDVNDRILVPVRAISEAFGCKVDWDDTKSQVIIDCDELTTDNKTVDVGTIATIPNDKNSFGYYDYLNSNEAQLDIDEIRRAQELATSYRDSIGRYTSSGQYSSENIQNYAYDAAKAMNNLKNNKIIKITKNEQTLSEIIEAYLEIKSASKAIAEDPYNKMLISMGKVMIHSNLVTAIEGHKKISESILKISTGQLMEILNQSN